jgi:hypothetical protein
VRRDFFQSGPAELANVDVELTGKQRPREIVLVLAPYGDPALVKQESHALAELMSLAHALTGENRTITLRFAGIPMGVHDPDGKTPIERFAAVCRGREERIMKVFVLGGRPEAELEEIRAALRTEAQGTILQALPATTETHATLGASAALKTTLISAIE